jgi:Fe-S cluster assembly ATP-binding protein
MMQVSNLWVKIGNKQILKGVDMSVNPGEVVAVMGPNGSGKSTLAYSLMGHPKYEVGKGEMKIDGKKINEMSPDERAQLGLYLANQYPMAIEGLISVRFLWQLYKKRNTGKQISGIVEFRKWLMVEVEKLGLNPELLKRGLNDGFSGGEKKKMEILQLLVFGPKYVILDEIDSGLDIDALKKIATTMEQVAKKMKVGVLVITHYNRIMKYLKADKVVVFENGKVTRRGGASLAKEVENKGYLPENNE